MKPNLPGLVQKKIYALVAIGDGDGDGDGDDEHHQALADCRYAQDNRRQPWQQGLL